MRTISDMEAQSHLEDVLDSAQEQQVVITRNGKPSAVVLGLESYDAEDLELAGSPEFWRMIGQRRQEGSSISLTEAKARLEARMQSGNRS